jgi:hypothetical protein
MVKGMTPCPQCHRHVRSRETACPFCSARLPVLAAVAVAALVGVAACGDKPAQNPNDVPGASTSSPTPINTGTAPAPTGDTDAGPRGGEVYGGPPPR